MPTATIIGKLRTRLKVQKELEAGDTAGDISRTWPAAKVPEIWADVQAIRAGELLEANRLIGRVTHRVIVRFLSWLAAGNYRLVVKSTGVILNIDGVMTIHGHDAGFLELTCVEEIL